MEKLELKDIAPYLPYGLNAIDIETKEVRIVTLLHFTYDVNYVGHNHLIYEGLLLRKHKPVLRPLSDLTKEIEGIGIPMQKLCRNVFYNEQYPKDWSYGFRNGIYFASAVDSIMTRLFEYNSIEMFFIGSNPRDDWKLNVEQYKAFQKLFEWHFDVFGLIEKGLAIDINTLKK